MALGRSFTLGGAVSYLSKMLISGGPGGAAGERCWNQRVLEILFSRREN